MLVIKGQQSLGAGLKVSGTIEIFREDQKEPSAVTNLKGSLKGKILVCPGVISKSVLEKARALDVAGIVCQKIASEEFERLARELKTSWSPESFAFLTTSQPLKKILAEIEGKSGTLEISQGRMVVET